MKEVRESDQKVNVGDSVQRGKMGGGGDTVGGNPGSDKDEVIYQEDKKRHASLVISLGYVGREGRRIY